jgi:RNA polymerase sigma factor (sigma-70 family)
MFLPWRFPASDDHHERVFIERLDKVIHWARQITSGEASLAEDLAQEAFLHFTAGRPSLEEISNLDKYLYVVLKNLYRSHLASVSRRCAVPFDPLAHENAMQTWRSVSPERHLALRDELRRICLFVCDRKETSKGASAFLLHFFHGLSVSDVSVLMQTTRAAVDERLSVVRKEARRRLERPVPVLIKSGSGEVDLMAELQSIIASSCRGECFTTEELQLCYAPGTSELPKDRLAHLASCSRCLGVVAQLLEFPRNSGSPPSAATRDRSRISRWQRKRAELLSTDPSELRLIVNGHLLATERVHSPDNDFSVSVALHEPLDFVEIWSGETTRLLFLSGISEPPDGKFEQEASLDLNGARLQLNLRFTEPWPTIAISYQACAGENVSRVPEHDSVRSLGIPVPRDSTRRSGFWPRLSVPAFSSVVALVLIGVLLFVQTRETTLGAAELLNRAGIWQQSIATAQAPVLHRRFSLISQNRGATVQRTFVEVWRRAGVNVKLSRWTDVSGRVLAEARLTPAELTRLEPGTIWQFEPSADAFAAAAGLLDRATVSMTGDHAIIRTGTAELVLDRTTNRPVKETFSLDTGDYIFTESSTETIPLAASPLSAPLAETRPVDKQLRASMEPRRMEPPSTSADSQAEERELQVRRELHALHLAAAATVVREDGTITVQVAPTSVEQEQQIRDALERIPGVNISILSARDAVLRAVTIGSPSVAAPASGKLGEPPASKWLKASLISEPEVSAEEERRIDAARRLVTFVAEWRLLAERYPVTAKPHLSAEARAILGEIVEDLRTRIRREVDNEKAATASLLRNVPNAPSPIVSERPCETWQSQAVGAADLIWENEQATEQFYAPTPSGRAMVSDADSLRKLRSLTDALDSVLRVSCNRQ